MSSAEALTDNIRTDLFTADELLERFGADNYIAIAVVFIISICIGLYHWYYGKNSTEDFMMASRNMKLIPATLSIVATTFSSVVTLGIPVVSYLFGTKLILVVLAVYPAHCFAAKFYVPVYYELGITTSLEYLKLRFGPVLHTLVVVVALIQTPMSLAVGLHSLSLVLNQMMGIDPVLACAVLLGSSIFYTSIGGLRGVMWTDVFQCIMMLTGFIVVTIAGIIKVGGMPEVFDRNYQSGRLELFNFDPDPRVKFTFWSLSIGTFFYHASHFCTNPSIVQRYNSCVDLKTAKKACVFSAPWAITFIGFPIITGLVAYAYYYDCDPLTSGQIGSPDQIIPHMVLTIMGDWYFLPGVFVAGALAACLSTVSTIMNTNASIIYVNAIMPLNKNDRFFKTTEARGIMIVKLLSVLVGFACFGFTFMAKDLPTVLDAVLTLNGTFAGPTFGAYTLGIMIPWASKRGAIIGFLCSIAIMFFIGFGQIVTSHMGTAGSSLGDKPAAVMKPLSRENCPASWGLTSTGRLLETSPAASSGGEAASNPQNAAFDIYYMWFTFIGFNISMAIGALVSCYYPQDVNTLDPLMVSHEIPSVVKAVFPKATGLGERCEIYYRGIGSVLREKQAELAADSENEYQIKNDMEPQVKTKTEDETVDI